MKTFSTLNQLWYLSWTTDKYKYKSMKIRVMVDLVQIWSQRNSKVLIYYLQSVENLFSPLFSRHRSNCLRQEDQLHICTWMKLNYNTYVYRIGSESNPKISWKPFPPWASARSSFLASVRTFHCKQILQKFEFYLYVFPSFQIHLRGDWKLRAI